VSSKPETIPAAPSRHLGAHPGAIHLAGLKHLLPDAPPGCRSGKGSCGSALFPPLDVYPFCQEPNCKSQFSRNRQDDNHNREDIVKLRQEKMPKTLHQISDSGQ